MMKPPITALWLGMLGAAAAVGLAACSGDDGPSREQQVAERGASVMPFDLDKTHHAFEQSAAGGVESVRVLDAKDSAQIELIRSHLRTVAPKFAAGDFSDPIAIHGPKMPGVAALSAGASRLKIEYADLPDGGKITYASDDAALVGAIHDWFKAQVSDHGKHASTK